jgi:DnaJ-class molecular chaperone
MSWAKRKAERTQKYWAQHGLKLVQCSACYGSGRYDANGSPPCGLCHGTGKVRQTRASDRSVW